MITEAMLRCFLALAETLSFTKAAEKLFLSQQAVSRNISTIEKQLSMKLFERDTHAVTLTPCGEGYYTLVKRLTTDYIIGYSDLIKQFGGASGTLYVGILDHPDDSFLQECFDFFENNVPHSYSLEVQQDTPDRLFRSLIRQKLDVIFVLEHFMQTREGIECHRIKSSKMAIGISHRNPSYVPGAGAEHYCREPVIIPEDEKANQAYVSSDQIRKTIERAGLTPSAIVLIPTLERAFEMCREGKGILLGTAESRIAAEEGVEYIPIPDRRVDFVAAWQSGTEKKHIRHFVECIAAIENGRGAGRKMDWPEPA